MSTVTRTKPRQAQACRPCAHPAARRRQAGLLAVLHPGRHPGQRGDLLPDHPQPAPELLPLARRPRRRTLRGTRQLDRPVQRPRVLAVVHEHLPGDRGHGDRADPGGPGGRRRAVRRHRPTLRRQAVELPARHLLPAPDSSDRRGRRDVQLDPQAQRRRRAQPVPQLRHGQRRHRELAGRPVQHRHHLHDGADDLDSDRLPRGDLHGRPAARRTRTL